jgi:uncharacterized membrane protein
MIESLELLYPWTKALLILLVIAWMAAMLYLLGCSHIIATCRPDRPKASDLS